LLSFGFLLVMFAMIRLHYTRPLLTWPVSVVLGWLMFGGFDAPLVL
jgi:hypothetical protein